MKKHLFGYLLLLLSILLAGCNANTDQQPAPTSVPLANPQTGVSDNSNPVIKPEHPISLPDGFGITVFADGLTNSRIMAFGPDGHLYVSEPTTGQILRLVDVDGNGLSDVVEVAADNLLEPSGIAFYQDGSLYAAETTRVLRLSDPDGDGYFQDREVIIAAIAAGGHTNRSLEFSLDWKHLYLAIGSSCNVCIEQDERRASVMRFDADGSNGRIFTTGLRHVIGLAYNPNNNILWVANMDREGLDPGLPPDTLYGIYIDADGGWPFCHAGRIIDPDFGKKDSCSDDLLKPEYELESQSAPYGMDFYSGDQFPGEYQKDLFIALHGTGEGDSAVGYKIVRIQFGTGKREPVQDFAVGWLGEDGIPWGTPSDLIFGPNGDLFLSDDSRGVIYRIFYIP